jgi:hypothetical protein
MHPGSVQHRQVFASVALSAAAVALLQPSLHWPSAPLSLTAAYLKTPASPQAVSAPRVFASYRAVIRHPVPAPSATVPRMTDDLSAARLIPPPEPKTVKAAPHPVQTASSAPAAVPYPSYSAAPSPATQTASYGSAQAYAESLVGSGQYSCLYELWERESGWNTYAENPTSGAYGIPQALPGDKMASAGPDWATDPDVQVRWGILDYINPVYGSPCAAWAHEEATGWYLRDTEPGAGFPPVGALRPGAPAGPERQHGPTGPVPRQR